MKMDLKIGGMSCQHCVNAVKEALAGVPDLDVETVTLGSATINPSSEGLMEQIRLAIEEEGFTLESATDAA